MKVNWLDITLFLIPMITGFASAFFCHVGKDAGSKIKARPPSWVFSVVWPILYILIGIAWVWCHRDGVTPMITNSLFGLTVGLMVLWIVVYGCGKNKKGGLYILLLTFISALALMVYTSTFNKYVPLLLAPYVGWLFFATMLNYKEVNDN